MLSLLGVGKRKELSYELPQRKSAEEQHQALLEVDNLRIEHPWAFPYAVLPCATDLPVDRMPLDKLSSYMQMFMRQGSSTLDSFTNLFNGAMARWRPKKDRKRPFQPRRPPSPRASLSNSSFGRASCSSPQGNASASQFTASGSSAFAPWATSPRARRPQPAKKGSDPLERFNELYGPGLPEIALSWREDACFADQRANGLFPWFLEQVRDLPKVLQNFPVTDTLVAEIIAPHTLAELATAGRLFHVDQPTLEALPTRPDSYVAAPKELFWIDDDERLMPVAVQLRQNPAESPVFTPLDPPNLWLAVKMHCGSADVTAHNIGVHEGEMHFLMESVWVCALRNLNTGHPLRRIFAPFFHSTMFVNSFVRDQLKDGGQFEIFGPSCRGIRELLVRHMKAFHFRDSLYVVENAERRGLHRLPKCPYRDDTIAGWEVHLRFVQRLVAVFYQTDEDVAQDFEMQNLLRELRSERGVGCPGVPDVATRQDLAEFWTAVLNNVVSRHSYVANAGFKYFAYVPNLACHLRMPTPTSKKEIPASYIEQGLPTLRCAAVHVSLINAIDTFPEDFRLNNMRTPEKMKQYEGLPPETKRIHLQWQEELTVIDMNMARRNQETGDDFFYLMPSKCANQIWN